MSTTVKTVITDALRKLGVVEPSPEEITDGLRALQLMLDSWSLEDLLVPYKPTELFQLDPSKAHYRMGLGGDWDTVRPERVEIVRIQRADGSTYPVVPSSQQAMQYQSNVMPGCPSTFLFQADGLFGYVEFNAYPTDPAVLVTSLKPFDAAALDNFDLAYDPNADPSPIYPSGFTLAGIQQPLEFPTGYEQAIIYNLAVHLRPEYPGLTLPEEVAGMAARSKSLIKRRNVRPMVATLERSMQSRGGCYDIRLGP